MLKSVKREIEIFALRIRIETLKELRHLGFGHIGGAMSIVELIALLYGKTMHYNSDNPKMKKRDYLVCSKGHAGPAIYAALALKGFFELSELKTLNQGGTNLPSHCDKNKTPGIDMTTGSLGQGISTAIGISLGNRMDDINNFTYLIIGDGEMNEGQIWEGIMFAAHFKVDRLICFIDNNRQQLDGYTKDIMSMGDIKTKFESFGWDVVEIDGHNIETIDSAIERAKNIEGKPSAIILNTIKGKGCNFAEGIKDNHHMKFTEKQITKAILELEEKLIEITGVQK